MSVFAVGATVLSAAGRAVLPALVKSLASRIGGRRAGPVAEAIADAAGKAIEEKINAPASGLPEPEIEAHADAYLQAHPEIYLREVELAAEQRAADSRSEDPFIRRTRPLVVRWSVGALTWIIGGVPVLSLVPWLNALDDNTIAMIEKAPPELWWVLGIGIGLWTVSRGVEKSIGKWGRR